MNALSQSRARRLAALGLAALLAAGARAADLEGRKIFFRHNVPDANYGRLAYVVAGNLKRRHFVEGLSCEVVAFAAGHGICLTAQRGAKTTYDAKLFDADFKRVLTIPLAGAPSRCRVSRDGKLAALTVFVSGHAYASPAFSTQTLLIRTADAKILANLEDFAVTRDGRPFKLPDFNFWGVTFDPDAKHLYCALGTKGATYLLKGDIEARTATVVHENVECPSLSPDGTRIAYKKRFVEKGRAVWHPRVLDLATQAETPLLETRSFDNQIEWLDDRRVLYSLSENPDGSSGSTDVWDSPADGKSAPRLFLAGADSPAVAR